MKIFKKNYKLEMCVLKIIKKETKDMFKKEIHFQRRIWGVSKNFFYIYRTFIDPETFKFSLMVRIIFRSLKVDKFKKKEECIICFEKTKKRLRCCNKPVCKSCLEKIKDFQCPHCRKKFLKITQDFVFDGKDFVLLGISR